MVNYGSTSLAGFRKSNRTWQWWEDETLITTMVKHPFRLPRTWHPCGWFSLGRWYELPGRGRQQWHGPGSSPLHAIRSGGRYTDADGNNKPESTRCDALASNPQQCLLHEAYDAGARVHTNSWGTGPDETGLRPAWLLLAGIITQQTTAPIDTALMTVIRT